MSSLKSLLEDLGKGDLRGASQEAGALISNAITNEEAIVIDYFGPLIKQIVAAGEALGKVTIEAGIQVILDAATAAATSAATATGDKVAAAEAAFIATASSEGVTAIHNAEAGAIKAAVAIIQTAKG